MPHIVPPLGVSRKACLKDAIFGGPGSRPAAPCVTWSTQPCLVCSAMHRYAQSACILVLFSRVLLLGHLLFLVRVLQVRPHPVESVRVGFMSCSLQSWLACILSRRRSCRGDEGHFAPQPLDWSCCVGFRCLHRAVKGLKSNRRVSAIQSSWDPLDCKQQRESIQLGEEMQQVFVVCARMELRWHRCNCPVALVSGALPISLAWQSVRKCRWQVVHV